MLNLEQTCNNPHLDVSPDRNQAEIIGVGLPAFLLSKNFYSESIGMSQSAVLRPPFSIGPHCGHVFKTFRNLSGGTYPFALRELAFQLCLPQLPLSFCLVF